MVRDRQRPHAPPRSAALALVFPLVIAWAIGAPPPMQPGTARGAQVAGRLLTYDNRELLSAAVIMSPTGSPAAGDPAGNARINPDGTFVFRDVRPGRYAIRARGETERDGPPLFATFTVTVSRRDITGIDMTLTPGAVLQGRVRFERMHGHPPPAGPLRVRAPLADASDFGDTMTGTVDSGGAFRLSGVSAGAHVLAIEGLSFPWRIDMAKHKGRDLAPFTFEIDRDEHLRGIDIVVSDTAAAVTGRVATPDGAAARQVLAIAFPDDAARRAVPLRYVRTSRPDAGGEYRLLDLPPGDYLVAAVIGVSETEAADADLLERVTPFAKRVRLAAAERANMVLQAVRAPRPSLP